MSWQDILKDMKREGNVHLQNADGSGRFKCEICNHDEFQPLSGDWKYMCYNCGHAIMPRPQKPKPSSPQGNEAHKGQGRKARKRAKREARRRKRESRKGG